MENKQLLRAIQMRHSRRSFQDKMIPTDLLMNKIDEINHSTGYHLQLLLNNPQVFNSLKKSYGLFHGVNHLIALIGPSSDPYLYEKIGYYGEQLVLMATALNLDTCWVGGTYSKADCHCQLLEHEELVAVIAIGYGEKIVSIKDKMVTSFIHRKHKSYEQCTQVEGSEPDWFRFGVEAALLAPSALNAQPVLFTWKHEKAYASISEKRKVENIDLGIAKLHFELGASCGSFTWGNHASFKLEVENE